MSIYSLHWDFNWLVQDFVSRHSQLSLVNVLLARTLANSLDQGQAKKMLGLIWIQTVCHSDSILERISCKL